MHGQALRDLLHDQPLLVVRRQLLHTSGRQVFMIRGGFVDAADHLDVELISGPRIDDWTTRVPACPDCGGELLPWKLHGYPAGAHRCCGDAVRVDDHGVVFHPLDGCGSVFNVVTFE